MSVVTGGCTVPVISETVGGPFSVRLRPISRRDDPQTTSVRRPVQAGTVYIYHATLMKSCDCRRTQREQDKTSGHVTDITDDLIQSSLRRKRKRAFIRHELQWKKSD